MKILYGKNKSFSLEIPSSCLVISNPIGSEQSVEQLAQDAIAHPLGLPGLTNCFTADDTVAIALGEGIVHANEILPVLIDQLLVNGVKKENITIVVFGGKTSPESMTAKAFPSDSPLSEYNVHVHYTDQPQAYTIVSTMESGEPLAFVRPIVEADVVIPVGIADPVSCASPWSSRFGVFSSVYPRFAMKESHARFEHPSVFGLDAPDESQDVPEDIRDNISNKRRTAQDEYDDLEEMARIQWEEGDVLGKRQEARGKSEDSPAASTPAQMRQNLVEEARQAGWELGVYLLLEIIPGAGDSIAHIVFGTPDSVEKEVERIHALCIKEFNKTIISGVGKIKFTRKPKEILCAVGGEESRQTWLNIIEALETAAEKGADSSSIFLCANITEPLGPGLKVIMDGSDLLAGDISAVATTLYNQRFPDSLLALRWLRLVEKHRIYWLSNLENETIEKLGAVPLESVDQLQRVLKQDN